MQVRDKEQVFPDARHFKCTHEGSQGREHVSFHRSACLPAFRWSSIQRRYLSPLINKISFWRCQSRTSCKHWPSQICVLVTQLCPTLCDPMDYTVHGISQARTMECHSLLQGIFPTQGLNPGLLHCRNILYQLSHQVSV